MELDLQSLFGLHVYSRTHQLRPRNDTPLPHHLGLYTRALLVSQDRRHLFVILWGPSSAAKYYVAVVDRAMKSPQSVEDRENPHGSVIMCFDR
jgi:hypothetical protein